MALVCYKHRFIFLKTRKTAGTSVEMALEPLCVPPGTEIREHRSMIKTRYGIVAHRGFGGLDQGGLIEGGGGGGIGIKIRNYLRNRRKWYDHASALKVRLGVGRKCWRQSARITTVRNPFDKIVSRFHFRCWRRGIEFEDFSSLRASFLEDIKRGFLTDDKDIVFLWGKYIIDHAIRFEHLHDDLRALQRELALPVDLVANLPHTKSMKESRKSYPLADYFDQQAIDIVTSRLAWVFDRFDYPTRPEEA